MNFKKVFFVALLSVSVLLSACSKIKNWPAQMWDKVFVQYTANFVKYPDIVYDSSKMHSPDMDYVVFELWKSDILPSKVQEAIVGMKAWETKSIKITPKDLNLSTWYNSKNIIIEPAFVYSKANIKIYKWKVMKKNWKYVVVKAVIWTDKNQKIVFDANPLETYNDIIYKVKLLQVWGKELKTEK